MNTEDKKLITAAREARGRAYAPYSNYQVGAAVLTRDDQIISGCNIENASYSLSLCAETVALCRAVAEGHLDFKKMVVVTDDGGTCCGSCRQRIWELCGDIPILIVDKQDQIQHYSSSELLPKPFRLDFFK